MIAAKFPAVNGAVHAIAVAPAESKAGILYIGGSFTQVGGQSRNNAAAFNLWTGELTSWNPDVNGPVHAILAIDGAVYLGGAFTQVGGQSRSNLAAVDATNGAIFSWKPDPDGTVETLACTADTCVRRRGVSNRGRAGSRTARRVFPKLPRVARMESRCGRRRPCPGAPGLHALRRRRFPDDCRKQSPVRGGPRRRHEQPVALESAAQRRRPHLRFPGFDGFHGRRFHGGRRCFASLCRGDGWHQWNVATWNPVLDGTVRALATFQHILHIGGDFTHVGGTARSHFATVDDTTGQLFSWAPASAAAIHSLQLTYSIRIRTGSMPQLSSSAALNPLGSRARSIRSGMRRQPPFDKNRRQTLAKDRSPSLPYGLRNLALACRHQGPCHGGRRPAGRNKTGLHWAHFQAPQHGRLGHKGHGSNRTQTNHGSRRQPLANSRCPRKASCVSSRSTPLAADPIKVQKRRSQHGRSKHAAAQAHDESAKHIAIIRRVPQNRSMKIAVLGSGSIGLYYGTKLAARGRGGPFSLLRGGYDEAARDGIHVFSPEGDLHLHPVLTHRDTASIGPCDLVLIALKTTQNAILDTLVPPLLGPDTMLLTLQNGLGSDEALAERFGAERVLGGLCFVCLTRRTPRSGRSFRPRQRVAGRVRARLAPAHGKDRRGLSQRGHRDARRGKSRRRALEKTRLERAIQWPRRRRGRHRGGQNSRRSAPRGGGPRAHGGGHRHRHRPRAPHPRRLHRFPDRPHTHHGPYQPSTLIDFLAGREIELDAIWAEPLRRARAIGVPTPHLESLVEKLRHVSSRATKAS